MDLYTYCENDGVNAWDPSGHYKVKEAIRREIKGMTYYSLNQRIYTSLYSFKLLKDIVKDRVVKTWCKKKNKNFIGVDDYELLARTMYFELSANNKKAKTRRNEIVTFYKVVKARMYKNMKAFGGNTMRGVLKAPMQFCGLTYFKGKKANRRGYSKIKINKNKIDLSWVRSVIVATVAEINPSEKYTSKLKYPDKKDYYFWHNKKDWKKFTNSSRTKVWFDGDNNIYEITLKKKYSDTYFYNKGKIVGRRR